MRKSTALFAGMALSALVLIGLTVTSGCVLGELHRQDHQPRQQRRLGHAHALQRQECGGLADQPRQPGPRGHRNGIRVTVQRGATTLFTGALKNLALAASGTIAASGTDTLTFDLTLPAAAGNTFQSPTQDFTIAYTATQLAGAAR